MSAEAKVDRRRYPYRRPAGPGLQEMRLAAKPGECPFCGEPALPRSAKPSATSRRKSRGTGDYHLGCGSPDCKTAYFRLWRRDIRAGFERKRFAAIEAKRVEAPSAAKIAPVKRSPLKRSVDLPQPAPVRMKSPQSVVWVTQCSCKAFDASTGLRCRRLEHAASEPHRHERGAFVHAAQPGQADFARRALVGSVAWDGSP